MHETSTRFLHRVGKYAGPVSRGYFEYEYLRPPWVESCRQHLYTTTWDCINLWSMPSRPLSTAVVP